MYTEDTLAWRLANRVLPGGLNGFFRRHQNKSQRKLAESFQFETGVSISQQQIAKWRKVSRYAVHERSRPRPHQGTSP